MKGGKREPMGEEITEPLWIEEDAASFLKVAKATLRKWRWSGDGPPFIKLTNRAVRYYPPDVRAYAAARRKSSTSDTLSLGRAADENKASQHESDGI